MFWKKKSHNTDTSRNTDTSCRDSAESCEPEKNEGGFNENHSSLSSASLNHQQDDEKSQVIDDAIYQSQSRREAFRYAPEDGSVLFEMTFLNTIVKIMDLSAGGLSFLNTGFNRDDSDTVTLILKDVNIRAGGRNISQIDNVKAKIIDIDNNNICHAIFEDLSNEDADILHQYILEKQKQDIRKKKQTVSQANSL
ncbi:Conserved hypothetical protein [Desulfamplus magnetovallimortis]|uniref:PilZ domain-containing protein n=1 Tax=Desulfamplus magnetovallimortis TaxID=1246637 RepID=L0R505_9BACT|nr:PilZ domain-containing protein [Desulfamplus magnetovallimortis]CCO06637.1 Conserved hypothetical protein [Desulfamplus magnetovallimortis BW-1]SLM32688.1 Conserved hypothetical protein [Desulfamplus magnetovallimortis]